MKFGPGRTYQIINKHNGLAFTPKSWSTEPSKVEQYDRGTSPSVRSKQAWHLFPMDNDTYLIVNKHSGLALTPKSWSAEPTDLEQYHINRGGNLKLQLWYLVPRGDGSAQIVNKHTGLVITPESWSDSPRQLDVYYRATGGSALERQSWKFEIVDEYKAVIDLEPIDMPVDGIGDVNRFTSHSQPLPLRTEEVLIGQAAVPFAVQDGGGSAADQSRNNPYLIIKRYGYWDQVFFYEHAGNSEHEEIKETTVGLTKTSATEVERSTGISVTAEASFAYKGFSAGLSSTVTNSLKTTYSSSESHEHWVKDTIRRTYANNGKRVSEALWYRGDRYVVQRMDGTAVVEWETRTKEFSVLDGFPQNF
ncbi:RICIN domain-containing protein [Streptomyces natalensis]|uniref:Uncharacterized protein n=1 Tax=Streptomyces natalensis ATCC 27448 TaxID=1240678 RepID=A0A0D7CLB1_9ACTN|nr:RICIN domain-containing protein [Streptomyces natalensis]KIZ17004.1 hypothetical protein SNA_18800 [Streptomyces natalensis ATCC 27448]